MAKITKKSDYVSDFDRLVDLMNELKTFCDKNSHCGKINEAKNAIWLYVVENYDDVERIRAY